MKYVNIDNLFLQTYLLTIVKICHKRKAPATGGMVATILKSGTDGTDEKYLLHNFYRIYYFK